jgi:hypothetical protein
MIKVERECVRVAEDGGQVARRLVGLPAAGEHGVELLA